MISVKNIRIPRNYLLVKVDDDYSSYQFSGNETGILAPNYTYENGKQYSTPSKNFSVFGKVYGVPEKLDFFRDHIKSAYLNNTVINTDKAGNMVVANGQLLREINELKKRSCKFESDVEISVGDTVKFSYFAHITATENDYIFETEEGKMYFIKYDDVYMTVDENNKPLKMVNGYVLVQTSVIETKKDGGVEYEEAGNGLVIAKLGTDSKRKRGLKTMEGKVVCSGNPLKVTSEKGIRMGGYIEIEDYFEEDIDVNEGDVILFDHRASLQLEHSNHQVIAEEGMYMIQRKDILIMEKENPRFKEIGLDKVNYDK